MKPIHIHYRFQMEDGQEELYKLELDPVKLETISEYQGELPDWTQLEYHQCDNCPLSPSKDPRCPAAVNMVGLVNRFKELLSYDRAKVAVVTDERLIYQNTTVQRGICSLMGLLMAASSCPMTAFFKPMARFHLPFASTEETIWRATSTYLLAQYYHKLNGRSPDICFEGLSRIYNDIQIVNLAFAKRLRAACRYDSMVNAIILLDMFAQSMPLAIDESLEQIRHLFAPYLSHSDS